MRHLLACLACLSTVLGATASAAAARSWTGQATSMDRGFRYGEVTFTTKGSTMRNVKIESVTVSGCGGFMTIVVPKARIDGRRFTGAHQPVAGTDQIVSVNGTISDGRARGTFSAGPLCEGAGRFTARAR